MQIGVYLEGTVQGPRGAGTRMAQCDCFLWLEQRWEVKQETGALIFEHLPGRAACLRTQRSALKKMWLEFCFTTHHQQYLILEAWIPLLCLQQD